MFEESKLKLEERDTGAGAGTLALYSELLRLREGRRRPRAPGPA